MKTKGCMFIALIISGAAFGQQAAVKQSVKVDSKTQVNSSSAGASGKAEIKADSRVDGSAASGGQTAANAGAKTEMKSGNSTEGASAQGNGTASASGKAEIKADSRVEGSTTNGGEGAANLTQEAVLSGKENGVLSTDLTNAAEGAINTGGNGRGTLLNELNAAGDGALEHVSSNASTTVEATLNTATEIEATSTQNLEKVNDRLIKTGAAAKGIGAGLNATVNNALKIKAAPLKINTRIVGGAGLGIF